MYKLFTDKQENFECKLELEGASLSDSLCRLVIESSDWNLIFPGTISANGNVKIPIRKLKNIIPEGTRGKLKLEVIADEDTYFQPWQDDFETKLSKRATVEVKGQTNTSNKKVKVTVKKQIVESNLSRTLLKETLKTISKKGINKSNLKTNKGYIIDLVKNVSSNNNLTESEYKLLKTKIITYLRR
jgi:hypothetical protein